MSEESNQGGYKDEIYSNSVRAGKRTYFFDVKSTRGGDLYLTITESKKQFTDDGKFHFQKHKLFLYKEDFEKFSDGLKDVLGEIEKLRDSGDYPAANETYERKDNDEISFEDLD